MCDKSLLPEAPPNLSKGLSCKGAMEGLSIIQGNIKGILQHNVLALDEQGIPQGIIYQKYWSRKGTKEFGGVEGTKQEEGLSAVNKHLADVEKTVVLVSDREGHNNLLQRGTLVIPR